MWKYIRITVLGDEETGKKCLLTTFKNNQYPYRCEPAVCELYSVSIPIGNDDCTLIISDTGGQEKYDKLRPLSYRNTDIFIICFAVDNRASYKNIKKKWVPEIRNYKPHSIIILLGTKIDHREKQSDCITPEEGEALRKQVKADIYVECSSKQMVNVSRVFAEAIRLFVGNNKRRNRRSVLRYKKLCCWKCLLSF